MFCQLFGDPLAVSSRPGVQVVACCKELCLESLVWTGLYDEAITSYTTWKKMKKSLVMINRPSHLQMQIHHGQCIVFPLAFVEVTSVKVKLLGIHRMGSL